MRQRIMTDASDLTPGDEVEVFGRMFPVSHVVTDEASGDVYVTTPVGTLAYHPEVTVTLSREVTPCE